MSGRRVFTGRLSLLAVVGISVGLTTAAASVGGVGCGSSSLDDVSPTSPIDASARKDSAPVEPSDAGVTVDSGKTPPPTCGKYCELVMSNCTGENAQYETKDECLAFCGHLRLGDEGEEKAASVGCRQYWADSPARTSATAYCLAAGPFGGGVCGDRCTTFCGVLLSACSPDGGKPAYASQPECASACAGFSLKDAGSDGGGEGPSGPTSGDTLNCRLYHLRLATKNPEKCVLLRPDSGACSQ
jgi:hypothetical protein